MGGQVEPTRAPRGQQTCVSAVAAQVDRNISNGTIPNRSTGRDISAGKQMPWANASGELRYVVCQTTSRHLPRLLERGRPLLRRRTGSVGPEREQVVTRAAGGYDNASGGIIGWLNYGTDTAHTVMTAIYAISAFPCILPLMRHRPVSCRHVRGKSIRKFLPRALL